jgi:transcriptional regulator with XRE-family HTH domain
MPEIGKRIKELRTALGLTQRVFAETVGISRSHVANLEAGNTEPSEHLLRLILGTFESINPDWLRRGNGSISKGPDPTPEQRKRLLDFQGAQPFSYLSSVLDSCVKIDSQCTGFLVQALKSALKADPAYCPATVVEKLEKLLAKRHGEPFDSAGKLLAKCKSHIPLGK